MVNGLKNGLKKHTVKPMANENYPPAAMYLLKMALNAKSPGSTTSQKSCFQKRLMLAIMFTHFWPISTCFLPDTDCTKFENNKKMQSGLTVHTRLKVNKTACKITYYTRHMFDISAIL